MPVMQLSLESIKDLDDGRVSVAFMHELKRAVADCQDRPGDKNSRTVTLEVKLEPVIDEGGQCEEVKGEFQIKSKVPQRKSKTFSFGVRRGGILVHNVDSPDDIDQKTLLE